MKLSVFSAYTFSENVQIPKEGVSLEALTLVGSDGSSRAIHYIKRGASCIKDFTILGSFGNEEVLFNKEDVEKARKIFKIGDDKHTIEQTLVKLLTKAKKVEKEYFKYYLLHDQKQIQKEKNERNLKQRARCFHIITGILATPSTMLEGIMRFASLAMQVAVTTFNFLGATLRVLVVSKNHTIKQVVVETFKNNHKTLSLLSKTWTKDARVALLQMIPFIGPQLANQYLMSGALKKFYHAPAIGGILESANLSAPQLVYGFRSILSSRVKKELMNKAKKFRNVFESYYKKEAPSLKDAKDLIEQVRKKFPNEPSMTVRIPTKKGQYHDATVMFATGANIDNKTVVLYHGNMGHRNNDLMQRRAQVFLAMGFNVLVASYAGDKAIVGHGTRYDEENTPCNEHAMREDAQADLRFLKELGVRHLSVYGYSLGGSQAMNFSEAVGNDPSGKFSMEYVVLDRTFTSMADVTSRTVKNALHSSLMGRISYDLAERYRISEGRGKYVCDGLNNKRKISTVLQKQPFEKTLVRIFGGEKDALMGDQKNPVENFSRDLFKSANEARIRFKKKSDIGLMMVDVTHRGDIQDDTFQRFLFGETRELLVPLPFDPEGSEIETLQTEV